ncbi:MAG: LysR family transcriptional regulator [Proteobacteria bacterium]|nr:LysR family transcriptional regulator [Pseudomonadota bacterium]
MSREPLETAQLLAFTRTVEARSLSRAAAELRIPRATLGRRLARLEAHLGVRLLKRTTRRLSVTDAGESLYLHARNVLDAVARAEASVQRDDGALRGDLKISIPPLVHQGLTDLLVDFARDHPEVRVFVHASTEHVDLVGGGYDVALRATPQLEPGLVARTLVKSALVAVASPAYLQAHGAPRTTAELAAHRCLMMFQRGEIPETHWPLRTGKRVRVGGAFFANDLVLLANAARAGLGIALLPDTWVLEDLERGALVAVLPSAIGSETRLSVVFAERELLPAHVRAFIDALIRWGPTALVREAAPAAPKPRPRRRRDR